MASKIVRIVIDGLFVAVMVVAAYIPTWMMGVSIPYYVVVYYIGIGAIGLRYVIRTQMRRRRTEWDV